MIITDQANPHETSTTFDTSTPINQPKGTPYESDAVGVKAESRERLQETSAAALNASTACTARQSSLGTALAVAACATLASHVYSYTHQHHAYSMHVADACVYCIIAHSGHGIRYAIG